jgi:hypothetical protein
MNRIPHALSLALVCSAAVAACQSSSAPVPPPPPPGTARTYWMAENTSEIDLKLAVTQPTAPF